MYDRCSFSQSATQFLVAGIMGIDFKGEVAMENVNILKRVSQFYLGTPFFDQGV